MKSVSEVEREIAAFTRLQPALETEHTGRWVLLYQEELAGVYDSFEAAAQEAVHRFGRGPYLIRQVGAPPLILPASVMYHPVHA